MNALLSPSPTPQIFVVGTLIWANSNQQMGSIPPFQNFAFLPQEGQDMKFLISARPGLQKLFLADMAVNIPTQTVHMGRKLYSRYSKSKLFESW